MAGANLFLILGVIARFQTLFEGAGPEAAMAVVAGLTTAATYISACDFFM
jgi:hypothetical protein